MHRPGFGGAPFRLSSLPSAQLRTGAGTHNHRRWLLKRSHRTASLNTSDTVYGSLRSQGRLEIAGNPDERSDIRDLIFMIPTYQGTSPFRRLPMPYGLLR